MGIYVTWSPGSPQRQMARQLGQSLLGSRLLLHILLSWHSSSPHDSAPSKCLCNPRPMKQRPMQNGGWQSLHPIVNLFWSEPCPEPCQGSQARSREGAKPDLDVRQKALCPVLEIGAPGWDSLGAEPLLFNGPCCCPLAWRLKGLFAVPTMRRGL